MGSDDGFTRLKEVVDLALIPGVISERDQISSCRAKGLIGGAGEAFASRAILAIDNDEVVVRTEVGKMKTDRPESWRSKDISYEEDAHDQDCTDRLIGP